MTGTEDPHDIPLFTLSSASDPPDQAFLTDLRLGGADRRTIGRYAYFPEASIA
jgi:hypothetical protein